MLRLLLLLIWLHGDGPVPAPRTIDRVKVVTSLTTYASIARDVVGDRGTVTSIATGDENPHYVQPKPSFVPALGEADLFVTTGLDLELWVPALLDKANNPKGTDGGPGSLPPSPGIDPLAPPTPSSPPLLNTHLS